MSENSSKITLPHKKQVYRIHNDQNGLFGADVVALWDEQDICEMQNVETIFRKGMDPGIDT